MTTSPPHRRTSLHLAALALVGLATSAATRAADAASAGFERMLSHEATTLPAPCGPCADRDPLVAALTVPLRDGATGSATARVAVVGHPADAVAQSFARMLNHQPGAFRPSVPVSMQADPLVAAIVEPLRRSDPVTAMASRR